MWRTKYSFPSHHGEFAKRLVTLGLSSLVLATFSVAQLHAQPGGKIAEPASPAETLRNWKYNLDIQRPTEKGSAPWEDAILLPPVFDGARADFADLRLYDGDGHEVPYDLRVRRADFRTENVPGKEFNRARGPDGSVEFALDLGAAQVEHNDVEVQLPGAQYRRHARLEGSADGQDWRLLAEKDLIHFELGQKQVDDRRFSYPPSRFRYLRVHVERDPVVDRAKLEVPSATVSRRVEIPGESLTLPAQLGPREPIRTGDGPGSAWIIDLGGNNVPCERLVCDIADTDFVRNYRIEVSLGPDAETPFQQVADGVWRRTAGDARQPMVAEFGEILARRIRLVVTDASNPPLSLQSISFSAPARQVVFPHADSQSAEALRLYFGNPKAFTPRYDFGRNLPARLEPAPIRRALGPRQQNPEYVPEPKPLTDRWPWLIYVVLGIVSGVLAVIIVDLARQAIAQHDAAQQAAAPPQ
jgi:hypothetical protein